VLFFIKIVILQGVSRSRAVLLLVSLTGLKVCSPDGQVRKEAPINIVIAPSLIIFIAAAK